jgi:hypothetical protein
LSSGWEDELSFPFFQGCEEENGSAIWDVRNDKVPIIFGCASKGSSKFANFVVTSIEV